MEDYYYSDEEPVTKNWRLTATPKFLGRRTLIRGAGNRNMVGDGSNKQSGDTEDNTKAGRNKEEDTKMNILSNIQSMMPGEGDLYCHGYHV